MNTVKEKKAKLSMTKDALYTAIAANCLAALALGAQLFARSVVKNDPTTQSFHLIGFGCIWFAAMGFLTIFLLVAWIKFCTVPQEERTGAKLYLRLINIYLLIIASAFLIFNAILILIRIILTR